MDAFRLIRASIFGSHGHYRVQGSHKGCLLSVNLTRFQSIPGTTDSIPQLLGPGAPSSGRKRFLPEISIGLFFSLQFLIFESVYILHFDNFSPSSSPLSLPLPPLFSPYLMLLDFKRTESTKYCLYGHRYRAIQSGHPLLFLLLSVYSSYISGIKLLVHRFEE